MNNSRLATPEDIRQIYRLILDRDVDTESLEYWLPRIEKFGIRAPEFAALALSSEEHRLLCPRRAARLEWFHQTDRQLAEAEKWVKTLGSPAEALRALGADTWFHSFVLSDGTAVKGAKSLEALGIEFDNVFGLISLEECSVLDIGAWNGAFSFEAMRLGASRVLAIDSYTWMHPIFRGFEKFLYVRKDRNLSVEYKALEVDDISVDTVGKFDYVLFLGVFYHLREPISILDRLAKIVKKGLVLETYLDPLDNVDYPAMRFYPGAELADDPTNWWGPNRQCMEELLRATGFRDITCRSHLPNRGIFHARV